MRVLAIIAEEGKEIDASEIRDHQHLLKTTVETFRKHGTSRIIRRFKTKEGSFIIIRNNLGITVTLCYKGRTTTE